MFGWRRKKAPKGELPTDVTEEIVPLKPVDPQASSDQYMSDQPISGRIQDRFHRAPFAIRIAETIARRADPSSLVLGVFGPWGDGKTSVLEMMEESLKGHTHVITVRFNPWHFQSEELLLRGFFATLADGLGKSLPNLKEKMGGMLKKYGSLLSLGSLTLGGMVQLNPGEMAKGFGESLSTVGLDELKQRIDSLLAESGKRIVILIDDIDRLDHDETHSIFKLVKLSASFKHTCYVLAFDDDVVSASLGQRYGSGGAAAGRAFLEKIIQVPLHLPPADRTSLRLLAFEGVEAALKQAEITLEQSKIDAFVTHFVDGLEPKLETPRLAKLYTNALTFALPLLKGEADTVDLMLIEGIRVLYPQLYAGIRDHPDIFLRGERESRRRGMEELPSEVDLLMENCMPGIAKDQREKVRNGLLRPLFPRVGNMMYGGEWDRIWAKDQKICSQQYFNRFFTYGVPEGDVPDAQIQTLIVELTTSDEPGQRELLQEFVARRAIPRLIGMLRDRADTLEQDQAVALAEAIARNAEFLPRERGPMILGGTMMQGGILVSQLMRRVEQGRRRQHEAERIVQIANPVTFGGECLRWIQHSPDTPEDRRVLADGGELLLRKILAQRIAAENATNPIYLRYPKDAPSLYWLWNKESDKEEISKLLEERFNTEPAEVDAFLDCFVGEGWEMESGLPRRSALDRGSYDSISRLISPEYIVLNLKQRHGAGLDNPQYYPDDRMALAKKMAHQFVFIHNELSGKVGTQVTDSTSPPDQARPE